MVTGVNKLTGGKVQDINPLLYYNPAYCDPQYTSLSSHLLVHCLS